MPITKNELSALKSASEEVHSDLTYNNVSARASAYLAIETINQLKVNTRNNILFTLLGAFLGFISSYSVTLVTQESTKQDLQLLKKKLDDIQLQINHSQKYQSKKDSL